MLYRKKLLVLTAIICCIFILSGCVSASELQVKMGMKNNDFEYMKQDKIKEVVIQNTRDKGFRFVITDKNSISDLYDILSYAKKNNKKSSLQPDYVFEMHESGNKVYKFNYITGLDSKDSGNLWSNNKVYTVSNRIDTDIIYKLWNITTPSNFHTVYYDSIINVLDTYQKNGGKNKKIGIDIKDDLDVSKFIFSVDMEEFKSKIQKDGYNAKVIENDNEIDNFDTVMKVQTQGYKRDVYKCIITFQNKADNSEKKYYIWDKEKDNTWDISITADKAPNDF